MQSRGCCRYYVAKDWTPKKLEVLVDVPDQLDLEHLRGRGPQPGEELQPEDAPGAAAGPAGGSGSAPAAPHQPQPDAGIVAQLVSMGFAQNGAQRAAVATQVCLRVMLCNALPASGCAQESACFPGNLEVFADLILQ